MRDPDCLFCKIIAGELPSRQVDADERTVSFMDISPATRGHALVVPRNHVVNVLDADPEDFAAVAVAAQRLAQRAVERLRRGRRQPDQFRWWRRAGRRSSICTCT